MDVRITDISVSRAHAFINYYNGNFYVMDNGSKFGTLALIQKPVEVPYVRHFSLSMQLGRYLISMKPEIKKRSLCWRTKYEKLFIQNNKTFRDYLHCYPYLMGIKLGTINKRSIKTLKNKDGHEELNELYKRNINKVYADNALQGIL